MRGTTRGGLRGYGVSQGQTRGVRPRRTGGELPARAGPDAEVRPEPGDALVHVVQAKAPTPRDGVTRVGGGDGGRGRRRGRVEVRGDRVPHHHGARARAFSGR